MSTSTDSTDRKSRLLNIPPELRLIIYDYYFSNYKYTFARTSRFDPPLLDVCQLIREEALSAYKAHLPSYRKSTKEKIDARGAQRRREFDEAQARGVSIDQLHAIGRRLRMEAYDARLRSIAMEDVYDEELRRVVEAMSK